MRKNNYFYILFFVFLSMQVHAAEKNFVYCVEAGPQTFNPQLATDGATYNASSRTIYNRLVEFERGATRVVPSLAKSWTVSEDGKQVTFHLREDVHFHKTDYFTPTRKLNAEDVVFSFRRMWDEKDPFHSVGGGRYPSFEALQMRSLIKNIVRVNDLTVRFELQRPEAPFLANMAMDFASILSKEYADKLLFLDKKDNLDKLPVGTGPFIMRWYERDQSIRYTAHKEYFGGKPKIDQLVFSITPDHTQRYKKLVEGVCHMISSPSAMDMRLARENSQLRIISQAGLNITYLAMNVEKEPLNRLEVRRAIHHALDRTTYIKKIYDGNAQVSKTPVPPTMWSHSRELQDYGYDSGLAKKLLSSAGFPDGFTIELWYSNLARPYNPDPKLMAELIKTDLGKIGIKVKLVELPWLEFLDRSKKGEPALSLQGWTSDNGDPDNFLNNLLSCNSIQSGNNRARWCDKKFTFNVERARVTTNIRIRTEFYEEAQKIFKQYVPWVTLSHATVFKILRNEVQGYRISPFGIDQFFYVDLIQNEKSTAAEATK